MAGARNVETTKRIQNGGLQLGSPATCKLKSFRGFYGFREDIREARALREIDQSVVSAAIRVSSVQNIVKRNMKVKNMQYGRRRKPAATSKRPFRRGRRRSKSCS